MQQLKKPLSELQLPSYQAHRSIQEIIQKTQRCSPKPQKIQEVEVKQIELIVESQPVLREKSEVQMQIEKYERQLKMLKGQMIPTMQPKKSVLEKS